jgi:hypothetical protein
MLTEIDWQLDNAKRIVRPRHITDGELVAVEMRHQFIALTVLLPMSGAINDVSNVQKRIVFRLYDAKMISFQSDHMQNVINAMYVFNEHPNLRSVDPPFANWAMFDKSLQDVAASLFLVITPIVGIECVVAANELKLFELK